MESMIAYGNLVRTGFILAKVKFVKPFATVLTFQITDAPKI